MLRGSGQWYGMCTYNMHDMIHVVKFKINTSLIMWNLENKLLIYWYHILVDCIKNHKFKEYKSVFLLFIESQSEKINIDAITLQKLRNFLRIKQKMKDMYGRSCPHIGGKH